MNFILSFIVVFFFISCSDNININKQQNNTIKKNQVVYFIDKQNIINIKTKKTIKSESNISQKKIVILYDKNQSYYTKIANIFMAYMLNNDINLSIKFYIVDDKNITKYINDFNPIVIFAYIKKKDYNKLLSINSKYNIYLPLISKDDISIKKKNIYFGGISIDDEFKLIKKNIKYPIVEVYNSNTNSLYLHNKFIKIFGKKYKSILIQNKIYKNALRYFSKTNRNKSLILNMPLIDSSIFLSLLYSKDKMVKELFATSYLYNKMIFNLTKYNERKNLTIIAHKNSIDDGRYCINNINLTYDILAYTTILGLDYFIKNLNITKIINNNFVYDYQKYYTNRYQFIKKQ